MVLKEIKYSAEFLWENGWGKSALCSSTWRSAASNQRIPLSTLDNLQLERFCLTQTKRGEFLTMTWKIILFNQEMHELFKYKEETLIKFTTKKCNRSHQAK